MPTGAIGGTWTVLSHSAPVFSRCATAAAAISFTFWIASSCGLGPELGADVASLPHPTTSTIAAASIVFIASSSRPSQPSYARRGRLQARVVRRHASTVAAHPAVPALGVGHRCRRPCALALAELDRHEAGAEAAFLAERGCRTAPLVCPRVAAGVHGLGVRLVT